MVKKKYLVVAGPVQSRRDGQIHRIDCAALVSLYCVRRDECVFIGVEEFRGMTARQVAGLTILEPRYNGDYDILWRDWNKNGPRVESLHGKA